MNAKKIALSVAVVLVVLVVIQIDYESQNVTETEHVTTEVVEEVINSATFVRGVVTQPGELPPSPATTSMPMVQTQEAEEVFSPNAVFIASPYTVPETESERVRLSNHQSLLGLQADIRRYRDKLASDPGKTTTDSVLITEGIDVLYRDALVDRLLNNNISEDEKVLLLDSLEKEIVSADFSLLTKPGSTTDFDYLRALTGLLDTVAQTTTEDLTQAQVEDLLMSIYDLAKRRKRVSDNFYKFEMREFLLSDNHTLSEKLDYFVPFVNTGDWTVVRYGERFLRNWQQSDEYTASERGQITAFRKALKERKSQ